MYRHVALFRFKAESTDAQRQAVLDGLRALPAQIPELLDYRVGPDVGAADGNWDFAVVADFADRAGYEMYVNHPAHVAVATAHVRPILESRAAAQYES
jgi:hypothetical protein